MTVELNKEKIESLWTCVHAVHCNANGVFFLQHIESAIEWIVWQWCDFASVCVCVWLSFLLYSYVQSSCVHIVSGGCKAHSNKVLPGNPMPLLIYLLVSRCSCSRRCIFISISIALCWFSLSIFTLLFTCNHPSQDYWSSHIRMFGSFII